MNKKNSSVMRVAPEFVEYTQGLRIAVGKHEHQIPSTTEITKRIAIQGVFPLEDAGKGLKKIGNWKM
jgi:hypothetical protein